MNLIGHVGFGFRIIVIQHPVIYIKCTFFAGIFFFKINILANVGDDTIIADWILHVILVGCSTIAVILFKYQTAISYCHKRIGHCHG
ncbi:hypothetical protein D3C85_1675060 [compost metagenome]